MIEFPIHTTGSAPEAARSTLEKIESDLGFIPNLFAEMADAPAVLEAYLSTDRAFEKTSLSETERNVVRLAVSVANACEYCTAVHATQLESAGLSPDEIEKLKKRQRLSDPRLEALRSFTASLVRMRGHADDDRVEEFLDAGFTRPQIQEVVLGVSLKTLSNYINHLADTPVDEAFSGHAPAATSGTTTVHDV